MGCDIHMYPEVKKVGAWRFVYKYEADDYWKDWHTDKENGYADRGNYYGYDDRNYCLFSILARVRENEPLPNFGNPRGLPYDCSETVLAEHTGDGGDAHSESYLTLSELMGFDWNQSVRCEKVIPLNIYKTWDKKSRPSYSYSSVGGLNVRTIEESSLSQLKEVEGIDYYIKSSFQFPLKELCEGFIKKIERLKELDANPSHVRIVFWFDN